ncbi:MAG: hypothetical protein KatS3mg077_1562 [Candidatus Binatia bacterium]|nr:MAG: hypothetical protein KatS3mg077_1562 [Candidatus Binatia bacterium]
MGSSPNPSSCPRNVTPAAVERRENTDPAAWKAYRRIARIAFRMRAGSEVTIFTILSRDRSPWVIVTLERGTLKISARNRTSASLAAPSCARSRIRIFA